MILIVEGSNRVGKTTFINELKKIYTENGKQIFVYNKRYEINDSCQLASEASAEQLMRDINVRHNAEIQMLLALNDSFPDMLIVLDRFHLSELVYGKKYRHYLNKGCIELDKFLFDKDTLLIFIKSDYEHIVDQNKKALYMNIQNSMQEAYNLFYEKKSIFSFADENDIKEKAKLFFEVHGELEV